MKNIELKNKINKLQQEVWELIDECDPLLMKLKDRVMHSGFVLEES